jgi:acyl-CoA synthetase (AMP-forming)/AMP-acid ligase II
VTSRSDTFGKASAKETCDASPDDGRAAAAHEPTVIAIPDEKWSERPLACVAFKPGQNAAPEVLNAHLLQHGFAKWQLPGRCETIAAVRRTSTATFWKLKLRQMFPRQLSQAAGPGPQPLLLACLNN